MELMDRVLNNELILESISNYLPFNSLRELRLVNRTWNSVLTSYLGFKSFTIIRLNFLHLGSIEYMDLNPKLAINVELCAGETTTTTIPIQHFLKKYNVKIRHLNVEVYREFLPTLMNLTLFPFDKLETLTITESKSLPQLNNTVTANLLRRIPYARTLPKLKTLDIFQRQLNPRRADTAPTPFKKYVKKIIRFNRENLTELRIMDNFIDKFDFPYQQLKKLTIMTRNENVFYLERLLDSLYDNLVELRLIALESPFVPKRTIPVPRIHNFTAMRTVRITRIFPNLRNLNLEGVDMFNISSSLCSDLFPKLEHVYLSAMNDDRYVNTFLFRWEGAVESIKVVELEGTFRPQMLFTAGRYAFPNVHTLILSDGIDKTDNHFDSRELVELCQGIHSSLPNLKKLKLVLKSKCNAKEIITKNLSFTSHLGELQEFKIIFLHAIQRRLENEIQEMNEVIERRKMLEDGCQIYVEIPMDQLNYNEHCTMPGSLEYGRRHVSVIFWKKQSSHPIS